MVITAYPCPVTRPFYTTALSLSLCISEVLMPYATASTIYFCFLFFLSSSISFKLFLQFAAVQLPFNFCWLSAIFVFFLQLPFNFHFLSAIFFFFLYNYHSTKSRSKCTITIQFSFAFCNFLLLFYNFGVVAVGIPRTLLLLWRVIEHDCMCIDLMMGLQKFLCKSYRKTRF